MARLVDHTEEFDERRYQLALDGEVSDERTAHFTYSIAEVIRSRREQRTAVDIRFDTRAGLATFVITLDPVSIYVMCLVGCGLDDLIDDILDCWNSGHTTPRDLIACLKGKGHKIADDWAKCAVKCLMPWHK